MYLPIKAIMFVLENSRPQQHDNLLKSAVSIPFDVSALFGRYYMVYLNAIADMFIWQLSNSIYTWYHLADALMSFNQNAVAQMTYLQLLTVEFNSIQFASQVGSSTSDSNRFKLCCDNYLLNSTRGSISISLHYGFGMRSSVLLGEVEPGIGCGPAPTPHSHSGEFSMALLRTSVLPHTYHL